MAFGARRIFPIDTQPSTAVGVGLPFNGQAVFNSTYTTAEAIKYNIINYFLTNPEERYLNPNFGAGLRNFIFEQITTGNLDFLKEDIQQKLSIYFPSVQVQQVEAFLEPYNTDINQVLVRIAYSIAGTGISDNLQITFQQ